MKVCSTVLKGQEIGKIVNIPPDLADKDLRVTVSTISGKRGRFKDLYSEPLPVDGLVIPNRDELHER